MHKAKISLFLVVVLVAFVSASYVTQSNYFGERIRADLEGDLATASAAVARAKRLADHGQVAIAEEVCKWENFAEKFDAEYAEGIDGKDRRHQDMWEELSVWSEKLKARKAQQESSGTGLEDTEIHVPDLMYLIDASGEGVANLTDYGWWGLDISKQYPIVKAVGGLGRAARDLWLVDGQMVEVTVCPLTGPEGLFLGSVITGWILADGDAERLKNLTGMDVVFFRKDKVHAGTVDTAARQQIQGGILRAQKVSDAGRLEPGKEYAVGKTHYVAAAGLFRGYQSNAVAGYLLLADLDKALYAITRRAPLVGIAGFLLIFLVVGGVLYFLNDFTRPLVAIDGGIHEVINGNLEYWFEAEDEKDSLAGGMAHSLNMMMCVLQGKPIPEDDSDMASAGGWDGEITSEADDGGGEQKSGGGTKPRASMAGGIPGLSAPAPKKELAGDDADAGAKAPGEAD